MHCLSLWLNHLLRHRDKISLNYLNQLEVALISLYISNYFLWIFLNLKVFNNVCIISFAEFTNIKIIPPYNCLTHVLQIMNRTYTLYALSRLKRETVNMFIISWLLRSLCMVRSALHMWMNMFIKENQCRQHTKFFPQIVGISHCIGRSNLIFIVNSLKQVKCIDMICLL